ncbi:MAG: site-specific integrase [Blastochloris viridis]|uniref:Site-specific integrase n=1 Tax=Blastochloris viridis TaxID=1079 RepID=A0A6N4R1T1_BLAVI|nr:MAG: site-specific integrase [Blastochloris viridis]
MATIAPRKGKNGTTYQVLIRREGFPKITRTFSKLSMAKAWAEETETSIRKGEFHNVLNEAKNHTFAEVVARYKAEVLPNKSKGTQRVEGTFLKFWETKLGEYALSYIQADLISKLLMEVKAAGDTRTKSDTNDSIFYTPPAKSLKTMKYYRDHVEMLFNHAKQWGWTGSNPVSSIQRVTKINNSRIRFLSDTEREVLLKACHASPNIQLYPIVVFALSTGARHTEILNLTLDDINLERGQAILRQTKNGETRAIPIVRYLNTLLVEHIKWVNSFYEINAPKEHKRFLFPSSNGLAPIQIRKAWENARDKSGVKDFRFHDLRHSAASYLAMNGATLLEIADVLGHKTLQMVKRYSHLSESHTSQVVSKMNDTIFK